MYALALLTVFQFSLAAEQPKKDPAPRYDWVAIGSIGIVDLPAPYGDTLLTLLEKHRARDDGVIIANDNKRPEVEVTFYKNGQMIRGFKLFDRVVASRLGCDNDHFFWLDKKQKTEIRTLVEKVVYDPEALKAAIKKGTGVQRVQAARKLLKAKKERDTAIAVLREEIRSKDKEAAEEAISCSAYFTLNDGEICAGICAALKDEDLVNSAISAVYQIGPPAKASAPLLIELYAKLLFAKAKRDGERAFIIMALSSVDPESQPSRKLFLSCLLDKNEGDSAHIAAIRAIGRSGKNGFENIPLLEKIIAQGKNEVGLPVMRFAAVEAVFNLDPDHKDLVNWLCEFLADPRMGTLQDTTIIVRESIRTLGAIGPRANKALPLIRKHQDNSSVPYYQNVVLEALKRIEKR